MKSFRSLWLRAGTLTFASTLLGAGTAFAAAPNQEQVNPSNNTALMVLVGVLIALVLALVGGAVIAGLAQFGSRFFHRNLPTDEEMTTLRAAFNPADRPQREPFKVTARNEPVLVAIGMFIISLVLVSVFLGMTPSPRVVAGANAEAAPAAAALPRTGDFTKIVSELPAGNADNGKTLFNTKGCVGCHSLEKDKRLVGPSFYSVYDDAKTQVPGMGPDEYLYQSIVDPNAHIVATYQSGLMPATFSSQLTPQDMADLLAWFKRDHQGQP